MKQSSTRLQTQVHRADQMAEEALEMLLDEMAALDHEIFIDSAPAKTRARVTGKGADESWILVVRHGGKLVGYNCIRICFLRHRGKRIAMWNSRSGLLPSHRGSKVVGNFSLTLFLRFKLRFPLVPVYSLITLIHPSSFRLFTSRIPGMYPFPSTELSPKEQEIFDLLYREMGLEPVEGQPRFVVRDSTITRTSAVEADFWLQDADPSIRFFHRYNAAYQQGQAIATFFPTTFGKMARIAFRHLGKQLGNWKIRLGFGKKEGLSGSKIQRVPLFFDLPQGLADNLAKELDTRWLKPGETLLKEGDAGDSMFVVLKGALVVEKEMGDGVQTIAQVGEGNPVGEMGALLAGQRNATVRSFRYTQVMEIQPKNLDLISRRHGEFNERLQRVLGIRLADNHLTPTHSPFTLKILSLPSIL